MCVCLGMRGDQAGVCGSRDSCAVSQSADRLSEGSGDEYHGGVNKITHFVVTAVVIILFLAHWICCEETEHKWRNIPGDVPKTRFGIHERMSVGKLCNVLYEEILILVTNTLNCLITLLSNRNADWNYSLFSF